MTVEKKQESMKESRGLVIHGPAQGLPEFPQAIKIGSLLHSSIGLEFTQEDDQVKIYGVSK